MHPCIEYLLIILTVTAALTSSEAGSINENNAVGGVNGEDDTPLCTYQADVAFLVDASSSVGEENFDILKTFIKGVINVFDIASNKVRVSMLSYNRRVNIAFHLNAYSSKREIFDAIDNIHGIDIGTLTDAALRIARTAIFQEMNGDRAGIPNIAILLTDGRSTYPQYTIEEQWRLKNTYVKIFAIGIGRIDQEELNAIASYPSEIFSRYVYNFEGLDSILENFAKTACYAITGPTQTPGPSPTRPPTTATTIAKTDIVCEYAADVLLIMDASSSIGSDQFDQMKQFMVGLVSYFNVSSELTHVGVIRYNAFAWRDFDLNDYTSEEDIATAINGLDGIRVGTRTGHALKIARTEAFTSENGDREEIPNIIILATDGRSTYPEWAEQEADLLKAMGVQIFVIGIGGKIDSAELNLIANRPSYVFLVDDFDGLELILSLFAEVACHGITGGTPPAAVSTTSQPAKLCDSADVVFVLDASSSIGDGGVERAKRFVQDVVHRLHVGSDKVRVAFVKFNSYGETIFQLDSYYDQHQLLDAIGAVSGTAIGSRAGHALKIVQDEVLQTHNGNRLHVPDVVILITDGRYTYDDWAYQHAQLLKDDGVRLFSVGLGNRIDGSNLEQVASNPSNVYVHYLDDIEGNSDKLDEFTEYICEDVCYRADIVLVLNASDNMAASTFEDIKGFAKYLTNRLDIGQDKVRVGLITFNVFGSIEFHLNTYGSKPDLVSRIDNVVADGTGSRTDHALKLARRLSFQEQYGSRPDVPDIAIVVTDGHSSNKQWTELEQHLLKLAGVTVFSIGTGDDVDMGELNLISSDPDDTYTHSINDSDAIQYILNELQEFPCDSRT